MRSSCKQFPKELQRRLWRLRRRRHQKSMRYWCENCFCCSHSTEKVADVSLESFFSLPNPQSERGAVASSILASALCKAAHKAATKSHSRPERTGVLGKEKYYINSRHIYWFYTSASVRSCHIRSFLADTFWTRLVPRESETVSKVDFFDCDSDFFELTDEYRRDLT